MSDEKAMLVGKALDDLIGGYTRDFNQGMNKSLLEQHIHTFFHNPIIDLADMYKTSHHKILGILDF